VSIEGAAVDTIYNALEPPFIKEWYSNGIPRSNFPYGGYYYNEKDVFNYKNVPFSLNNNDLLLHLPNIYFMKNGIVNFSESFDFGKIDLTTTSDSLIFGLGPVHWFGKFINDSYTIKIKTNQALGRELSKYGSAGGSFFPFFKFQLQDNVPQELQFNLYDENSKLIKSGDVNNFSVFEIINGFYNFSFLLPVQNPDKYTLEISDTNYTVFGRGGKGLLRATMDTRLQDKNPPSMRSLNIIANNQFTDFVKLNQAGKIQFNINDDTGLKSTVLQYHSELDTIWRNLPVTLTDSLYTAAIPDKMPNEFISLRVIGADNSNNILDFILEPAFKFSSANHSPVITAIRDTVAFQDSLFREQIYASDIDGDALTYSLDI
jgi:hypothetical protein